MSTMKIRRCNSRSCSNSRSGEEENSELIPFDIAMEIISRLPAKSIMRFRCVSKQWESGPRRYPNLSESFFTRSSSRPKLLFTCLKDGKTFFFSSPHPQGSSPLAVDSHMSFPINSPFQVSHPVRGFVCGLNQQNLKGRTVTVPLICNVSTGQSLTLPKLRTTKKGGVCFLLYDPIVKLFKVLFMSHSKRGYAFYGDQFEVLTLGTTGEKSSWRRITCGLPHERILANCFKIRNVYDGVCINGVLYHLAYGWDDIYQAPDVVCFDITTEIFTCIRHDQGMRKNALVTPVECILVNYKGKLALLQPNMVGYGKYGGIHLWVVEDAEKHQWSSSIHVLPTPWSTMLYRGNVRFVGTTGSGEIVLSPNNMSDDSFYLLYYNTDSNTVRRVEIQGMEAFRTCKAYTILDHVENLELIPSA